MERSKLKLLAWAFYDFGNSAFSAIMETFVLPAFFVKQLYGNPEKGSEIWGLALGITGLFIALLGPIIGAIADQGGHLRRGLGIFTALTVICCLLLGNASSSSIFTVLLLFSLSSIGSEFAYIFYNSMLPRLAEANEIGKWSGLGWGFGYIGGVFSLIAALALIGTGNAIPTTFILTSIWYGLFALPLLFVMEKNSSQIRFKETVISAFSQLFHSIQKLIQERRLLRFFVARMFFIDGLTTLFAFGGIYAAAQFGMGEEDVLKFAIALNISAGFGAIAFGYLDDKFGPLKVMRLSLICLMLGMAAGLLATTIWQFWTVGIFIGLFVGPVQAASRSYLAKTAPKEWMSEMFGFFAFSGKATAFLGPLLFSLLLALTGSLSFAMSTVFIFFLIGLLLLPNNWKIGA